MGSERGERMAISHVVPNLWLTRNGAARRTLASGGGYWRRIRPPPDVTAKLCSHVKVPRDSSGLTLMLETKPFLIRYEQLDSRSK